VADDASDAEGSASVAKKRGRKSVSEKPADKDDERPTKKARKASEKKAPARESPSAQQEIIGDMQNHMTVPSWDHLVDKVDTVERVDDTLFVYFTLYVSPDRSSRPFWIFLKCKIRYSGERVREDSKKCADKFPKKVRFPESSRPRFTDVSLLLQLIDFYESNLRWKEVNH
jgi:chromobox protein 1/chromobox protein 5